MKKELVIFLLACFAPIGCSTARFELLKTPAPGSSFKKIQVDNVVVTSNA